MLKTLRDWFLSNGWPGGRYYGVHEKLNDLRANNWGKSYECHYGFAYRLRERIFGTRLQNTEMAGMERQISRAFKQELRDV